MPAIDYTPDPSKKRCSQCHERFPATLEYFRAKQRKPGELHSWCYPCARIAQRKAYKANVSKRRNQAKTYRQRHPGKVKASYQKWLEAHREARKISKKHYYDLHSVESREYSRQYFATHREKQLSNGRAWKMQHPEQARELVKQRRARKKDARINDFTVEQWKAIQEVFHHRCAYCQKRCKGKLTQDHLTPLSKGGNHTRSNIVPACRSCNSKKHIGPPLKPVQPLLLL